VAAVGVVILIVWGRPSKPAADDFHLPAGHLSGIVAAFAFSSAARVNGQATFGVTLNVLDVADRRITERILWVGADAFRSCIRNTPALLQGPRP
jgi:hypothetical protein